MSIVLSPDQEQACDDLIAALQQGQRVLVLSGAAGTGKTTLVRELSRRVTELGWGVTYAAPTGKAAERLSKITGMTATTVHSVLYASVRETRDGSPVFLDARAPCRDRHLFVVDEASMVDADLGRTIERQLPDDAAVLYVGDPKQLPPVMGCWAPDFDHATARLDQVHRQALESPILRISVAMREGGRLPDEDQGDVYQRQSGSLQVVASTAAKFQAAGSDVIVLCWTNKTRQRLNRLVRHILARDQQGPLVVGDRLLVLYNNKRLGRMNGEVAEVTAIEPASERNLGAMPDLEPTADELRGLRVQLDQSTRALVHPDLIGAPLTDFRAFTRGSSGLFGSSLRLTSPHHWLHVDYGNAITVHRSQGSEYNTVILVIDRTTRIMGKQKPEFARKLCYTAVTRAKERLLVFDV